MGVNEREFDNLHVIYQEVFDPQETLVILKRDFGCERIMAQTGGTLNAVFLRAGMLDYVDIFVAPVLIGGKETSSLRHGGEFCCEMERGNQSNLGPMRKGRRKA